MCMLMCEMDARDWENVCVRVWVCARWWNFFYLFKCRCSFFERKKAGDRASEQETEMRLETERERQRGNAWERQTNLIKAIRFCNLHILKMGKSCEKWWRWCPHGLTRFWGEVKHLNTLKEILVICLLSYGKWLHLDNLEMVQFTQRASTHWWCASIVGDKIEPPSRFFTQIIIPFESHAQRCYKRRPNTYVRASVLRNGISFYHQMKNDPKTSDKNIISLIKVNMC